MPSLKLAPRKPGNLETRRGVKVIAARHPSLPEIKTQDIGEMATKIHVLMSTFIQPDSFLCLCGWKHRIPHGRTTSRLRRFSHSSSLTLRANAYFLPTHTSCQRTLHGSSILCTEASKFIGTKSLLLVSGPSQSLMSHSSRDEYASDPS